MADREGVSSVTGGEERSGAEESSLPQSLTSTGGADENVSQDQLESVEQNSVENSTSVVAESDGNEMWTLRVKTLDNSSHVFSLQRAISVAGLKAAIAERTTLEVARQRLIFRGRVLEDENALVASYGVEDGHTIHCVARPANFREIRESAGAAEESATAAGSADPTRHVDILQSVFGIDNGRRFRRGAFTTSGGRVISGDATTGLPIMPIAPGVFTGATTASAAAASASAGEPPSLEVVRQNLLTLRTLLSSMGRDPNTGARLTPRAPTEVVTEGSTTSNSAPTASHTDLAARRFYVGQWLDVKDTVQQWLEATVMDVDFQNSRVFIHYNGWPSRWDEWISVDSPRIAPFRSRTSHSGAQTAWPTLNGGSSTTVMSPMPIYTAEHAPVTGVDDVRLLLPEVSRSLRAIGVLASELAEVCEQDLANRPSSIRTAGNRPMSRGMPWLNGGVDSSMEITYAGTTAESTTEYDSLSSANMNGPRMSLTPDSTEDTNTATTQQLQTLVREICPLFDRYGRSLVDSAALLWRFIEPTTPTNTEATGQQPSSDTAYDTLLNLLRPARPPSPPPSRAHSAPIAVSRQESRVPQMTVRLPGIFPQDTNFDRVLRSVLEGEDRPNTTNTSTSTSSTNTASADNSATRANAQPGATDANAPPPGVGVTNGVAAAMAAFDDLFGSLGTTGTVRVIHHVSDGSTNRPVVMVRSRTVSSASVESNPERESRNTSTSTAAATNNSSTANNATSASTNTVTTNASTTARVNSSDATSAPANPTGTATPEDAAPEANRGSFLRHVQSILFGTPPPPPPQP